MPTAEELLDQAEDVLLASPAIDHPHRGREMADAEDLIDFAVGYDVDPDEEVDRAAAQRFWRYVNRRARGEPTSYITGQIEFNGLTLQIGPGAFIPRQSSEFMVEQAVRRLRSRVRPVHVDLATGIGPVALAVADQLPRARVFGVDLTAKPVAYARRNAKTLKLKNTRFLKGDLFGPLPKTLARKVDVITIHPPYVGTREIRDLPDEIRRFEPKESLTDFSPMGMGLIGRVADEAPGWLRSGGWILVEVSPDRARTVASTLRHSGFRDVRSTRGDLDVSRVVVGRRGGAPTGD